MTCKAVLIAAERKIVFARGTGCKGTHTGEAKKIKGFTTQQWKLMAVTQAKTVEALILEFSRAGCPHTDKRVVASYLNVSEEPKSTLQVTMTRGALPVGDFQARCEWQGECQSVSLQAHCGIAQRVAGREGEVRDDAHNGFLATKYIEDHQRHGAIHRSVFRWHQQAHAAQDSRVAAGE